jgi:hypothetical protein
VQNGGAPGCGTASGREDLMEKKDKEKEKETPNPNRYWIGVAGASALALAIVVGVVMQVRTPKPETAAKTQAARTQAAVRTQAAMKPQAAVRAPAALKPQTAANPQGAVKPLTAEERKISETLWVEQRKLETDTARVMAATSDGRQRVAVTIAKHFNVPEKLVNELRGRKFSHGDVTVALALSQQLMKRDKVTQQKALDSVLGPRKSGQGWGAIARSLGLKLGDVVTQVEKVDRQVAKLDSGKAKTTKG